MRKNEEFIEVRQGLKIALAEAWDYQLMQGYQIFSQDKPDEPAHIKSTDRSILHTLMK